MGVSFLVSFMAVHFLPFGFGGRKFSVPFGMAAGQGWLVVLLLAFILDFIQIPIYYFIYGAAGKLAARFKKKIRKKEKKRARSKLFRWAQGLGLFGVYIISAIPLWGCGVWTSTLLAYLIKTKKLPAYIAISLGIITGILLLELVAKGIIVGVAALKLP